MPEIYQLLKEEKIAPTDIITHRMPLDEAERAFDTKTDGCIKVVLQP